jgi:hypothetical protein
LNRRYDHDRIALALTLALSTLAGIAGSASAAPYDASANPAVAAGSAYASPNPAIRDGLRTENVGGGS